MEHYGFCEIEVGLVHAVHEGDDLGCGDGGAVFADEAKAPIVGAEGVWVAVWPDLCAAVGNYMSVSYTHLTLPTTPYV